jgi:CPA2 family monovalent cation:H+ antiporter-2
MHDLTLLADFVILLATALGVAWAFSKVQLPSIVGFLTAGILLGPGVLGVVTDPEEITLLAEIGVVLLLFSIGLELSFREIQRLAHFVFGAGGLQVGLSMAAFSGLFLALGFATGTAVLYGAMGALSSTALVLTTLKESDEVASPHGRGMVGVLLLQDLAVVPLMLMVPLLADAGGGPTTILWTLAKATLTVVGVWLTATYIFPWVAERIVSTRRRELFTLFTVVVAVGTAWISGVAGLSLALGAFLAGLVISESPYSEQMITEVEPFKDVFNSIFFLSMGLLVEPSVIVDAPLTIAAVAVGVFALKTLLTGGIVWALGYGARVAVMVGIGLAQVGEFSLLLAKEGIGVGLISDRHYGIFIAVTVLTMAATPFFLAYSHRIADLFTRGLGTITDALDARRPVGDEAAEEGPLEDHVVVVGFGTTGQNLVSALQGTGSIPYAIAELNPQTVRQHHGDEPIHYGDATRPHILKSLGVEKARALIITTPDYPATRRMIRMAKDMNPGLQILARVRFSDHADELYRAGADHVVVEEFETSLSLISQVLRSYDVAQAEIERRRDDLRRAGFHDLRRPDSLTYDD